MYRGQRLFIVLLQFLPVFLTCSITFQTGMVHCPTIGASANATAKCSKRPPHAVRFRVRCNSAQGPYTSLMNYSFSNEKERLLISGKLPFPQVFVDCRPDGPPSFSSLSFALYSRPWPVMSILPNAPSPPPRSFIVLSSAKLVRPSTRPHGNKNSGREVGVLTEARESPRFASGGAERAARATQTPASPGAACTPGA